MKTIALLAQKGGTGETTLALAGMRGLSDHAPEPPLPRGMECLARYRLYTMLQR